MLLASGRKLSSNELTWLRIHTWCEICFEGDISYAGGKSYFYKCDRITRKQKEKLREIVEKKGLRITDDISCGLLDDGYKTNAMNEFSEYYG